MGLLMRRHRVHAEPNASPEFVEPKAKPAPQPKVDPPATEPKPAKTKPTTNDKP